MEKTNPPSLSSTANEKGSLEEGALSEVEQGSSKVSKKTAFRKKLRKVLDWADTLVKALALFILLYHWVFQISIVRGTSMSPLFEEGDRLIVEKWSYHFEAARQGDLVVFLYPRDLSKEYLKRIIAGPLDEVKIIEGEVFVNGKRVDYAGVIPQGSSVKDGQLRLRTAEYYVLGDNRPVSSDSRDFGPVPEGYLQGRVWLRFWPLSRWKLF